MKQPTGARVLVVDDEAAILRTVTANLGRRGFRVDVAHTGEAAIDQVEEHPDLVVLDLGLPDTDGLEVIRRIRARSDTPIIVLSARDSEREKVHALELGADDFTSPSLSVWTSWSRGSAWRSGISPVSLGTNRSSAPAR